MIKNVIFDVGQVLVAWEPVEAMRALGMDEETVRAVADATVHTSDWDEVDRGALSDEELLTGFIRKAPAYEAQIRNFWEHVDRAIYPFPYVGEWMRTLKDKGYRLYILSNYGAWTYAKTKDQSLGFLKDVDGALFSFEVSRRFITPCLSAFICARRSACSSTTDRTMWTVPSPAASLPFVLPATRTPDRN